MRQAMRAMVMRRSAVGLAFNLAFGLAVGVGLVSSLGGCKVQRVASQSLTLTRLHAQGDEAAAAGRWDEAAALYEQYIDIRPHETEVLVAQGRALLELGRSSEAREHLAVAWGLEPQDPEIVRLYGRALRESTGAPAAIGFARRAGEGVVSPEIAEAAADVLREAGAPDDAEAVLLSAARRHGSTSAAPHRALAAFYRALGDESRELERWRVVLWFDNEDGEARARLQQLGQVPGPTLALPPTAVE